MLEEQDAGQQLEKALSGAQSSHKRHSSLRGNASGVGSGAVPVENLQSGGSPARAAWATRAAS
jgi:hypothetical protein